MKSIFRSIVAVTVITTAFSLSPVKSKAQVTYIKPLLSQVNSNFNYGKSNGLFHPYKKGIKGLQAGASFQAGITPALSVVTEAYFTMKGAILKAGSPIAINESKVRLYNAELPVMARVHIGRAYLNAGPYVSYLIGGTAKIKGSETIPETSNGISFGDVPDGYNHWELGLQAGGGYNFSIKKTKFALDLRYGYGLTNISRYSEKYNRALTITVIAYKPWKHNPFAKKS